MVDVLKETRKLVGIADPASISNLTTFEELGYDSLDVLEFIGKLEQKLGVTICDSGDTITCIGELVSKFEKLLQNAD